MVCRSISDDAGIECEVAVRNQIKQAQPDRCGVLAQARLSPRQAALDAAVAAAYGWPEITPATPADDILRRLLSLNRERARIA